MGAGKECPRGKDSGGDSEDSQLGLKQPGPPHSPPPPSLLSGKPVCLLSSQALPDSTPPSRAHCYLSLGLEERRPGEGGNTSTAESPARVRLACGTERHQGRSQRLEPVACTAVRAAEPSPAVPQAQHQRAPSSR